MTKMYCDLCDREITDRAGQTPIKQQIQMKRCMVEIDLRVSFPGQSVATHCCRSCAVELVAENLEMPSAYDGEAPKQR